MTATTASGATGPGRPKRGLAWFARLVATAPIRLYRRVISPALPARCKYHPSCASYAVQAIERFGILRGLVLAGWRLLRCNPWSHGGVDPVEEQRLFAKRPRAERGHTSL